MLTINRSVIMVTPKKPYIDWANSFDDGGATLDSDEVHGTAVLIPEKYDQFNYENYLKRHFKSIFEEELSAWMQDPAVWPPKRTYKLFREWFETRFSDTILDFGKDPVVSEEY